MALPQLQARQGLTFTAYWCTFHVLGLSIIVLYSPFLLCPQPQEANPGMRLSQVKELAHKHWQRQVKF